MYAKRIQDAVLTPSSYLNHMFPKHFLFYQPKDIVSGDFYWAYLDPVTNKYFWVVGDCTGHGVPGALMSVIGSIMLNEIVIVGKIHEPNKILKKLSKYIKKYINTNDEISRDGMELSLFVWDKDEDKVSFCGANGKAFIYKNGGAFMDFKGSKQPIGYDPLNRSMEDFEVIDFKVSKGDWIIAFTDGYPDQLSESRRKKYKVGYLKNNLVEWIRDDTVDVEKALRKSVVEWMGNASQIDDMLIFGVKV